MRSWREIKNLKRPRGHAGTWQYFSEGGSQEPRQEPRGVCEAVRRARAHASSAI